MNYVLLVLLIFLTLVNYYISNYSLLSPGVIVSGVFSLSSLVYVLNATSWNYMISFKTMIIIIFSIIAFSIGAYVGQNSKINTIQYYIKGLNLKTNINVNNSYISRFISLVVNILCLIVVLLYFRHQYLLSISLGNVNGIMGMLKSIRAVVQTNADAFQLSKFMNVGIAYVRASGVICMYFFINCILNKKSRIIRYIIPIVCMLLLSILSSGRSGIIGIIATAFFDYYIIRKRMGNNLSSTKLLILGGFSLGGFLVVFRLLGMLTGNTSVYNLWDAISVYIGSPILCFDYQVNNLSEKPLFWGLDTFRGLYNLLSAFKIINIPMLANHAETIRWPGYSSNIYSSLSPYYKDFGVIGLLIIESLVGLGVGILWKRFNEKKARIYILVLYGRVIGSSLVFYSIAERFLSNNLALNVFVELFICYILLSFFVKVDGYES